MSRPLTDRPTSGGSTPRRDRSRTRPGTEPSAIVTPVAATARVEARRLFALTLFLSASLLFCVQPMVGRLVLPTLGGSPAVWNGCQVFFQAALLAGYLYAHALSRRRRLAPQLMVHAGVLLAGWWLLPIGLGAADARGPAAADSPVGWLLATLFTTVGLPFFVVAATAPLLQRWYAETGTQDAHDPYFLYAASNLGSMLALLSYPLIIEPCIRIPGQLRLWSAGYAALAFLVVGCGLFTVARPDAARIAPDTPPSSPTVDPPIGFPRTLRWVLLAFVPSSLMLGVTSYLTTDLAAVPLLWVVPLALYLLTFILVFARRAWLSPDFATGLLPPLLLLVAWNQAAGSEPRPTLLVLHLGSYFLVALVCHGALAADRPPARGLTGYYLAMSIGGVLGGLFNALAAPVLFSRIVEYPLVLGLACLALPGERRTTGAEPSNAAPRWRPAVAVLGALAGVVAGRFLALGTGPMETIANSAWLGGWLTRGAGGVAAAVAWLAYRRRPTRLALVALALLFAGFLPAPGDGHVLWRGRDFFGVLTVTEVNHDGQRDHRLVHGRTLHGRQNLDPATAAEPLTYYARTGPVADLFAALDARTPARRSVGVVGLGAGSTAAYARPGDHWVFYEIDPAVVRVANDPRYFTYLARCQAAELAVVVGDARLRLREARAGTFDLLMLDAFSSDAIPVHLLTREALALDRSRLAPGGLLAFHISNRYLDLAPVLATLAREAGLICRVRADLALTPTAEAAGKTASIWAVLSATERDLGPIARDPRWTAPTPGPPQSAWTDDYSDIVPRLLGWR